MRQCLLQRTTRFAPTAHIMRHNIAKRYRTAKTFINGTITSQERVISHSIIIRRPANIALTILQTNHKRNGGNNMRPAFRHKLFIAMQQIMVINSSSNIGSKIAIAHLQLRIHIFGGEIMQFHINRHSRAQLPPPRAIIQLSAAQIIYGAFPCIARPHNMQTHRRF